MHQNDLDDEYIVIQNSRVPPEIGIPQLDQLVISQLDWLLHFIMHLFS